MNFQHNRIYVAVEKVLLRRPSSHDHGSQEPYELVCLTWECFLLNRLDENQICYHPRVSPGWLKGLRSCIVRVGVSGNAPPPTPTPPCVWLLAFHAGLALDF